MKFNVTTNSTKSKCCSKYFDLFFTKCLSSNIGRRDAYHLQYFLSNTIIKHTIMRLLHWYTINNLAKISSSPMITKFYFSMTEVVKLK